MTKYGTSLLEFSKQQQSKRVEALAKGRSWSAGKVVLTKTLPTTRPPASIIRLVPNRFREANPLGSNPDKQQPSKKVKHEVQDSPGTSSSRVPEIPSFHNVEPSSPLSDIEDAEDADSDDSASDSLLQNSPLRVRHINALKRDTAGTSSASQPSQGKKSHSIQCCTCCREKLDTILQQQEEILSLLKNTKPSTQSLPVEKLDLLPAMPFNEINDFLDFDESLANENVQYQFMVKLNRLLVATEQKSISNIMSAVLTNEICKNISWIGVKDTIPFGTSNMVGVIVDLIQEHHQVNIDSVKSRVAEWLRRCGDRINNELKRRKRKLDQGYPV